MADELIVRDRRPPFSAAARCLVSSFLLNKREVFLSPESYDVTVRKEKEEHACHRGVFPTETAESLQLHKEEHVSLPGES